MEKTIPLGNEGQVTIKIVGDQIVIDAVHTHASGKANVHVEENIDYLLDRFDDKVNLPFGLDKMLIMAIKAYLKAA